MSELIAAEQPVPDDFNPQAIQGSYLELFYATLFHPVRTFALIAAETSAPLGNRQLFFASLSVVGISALAPLLQLANQGGETVSLFWQIPLSAVAGVILWGLMGLFISLFAYAFTAQARAKTFLALSGLATLPWILMGPVSLLKIGLGPVGVIAFVLLALLVWLWSVLLFALALAETYKMSPERVLIILAAPFALSGVLLAWVAGFIDNISQLAFHG